MDQKNVHLFHTLSPAGAPFIQFGRSTPRGKSRELSAWVYDPEAGGGDILGKNPGEKGVSGALTENGN